MNRAPDGIRTHRETRRSFVTGTEASGPMIMRIARRVPRAPARVPNPGDETVYEAHIIENGRPAYGMDSQDSTLRLIAFVFCVISTVTAGWMLIPLAWMVPMTVCAWGIYKGRRPNTTAFGVCTLIFVSLVGGILLLVSKKDA